MSRRLYALWLGLFVWVVLSVADSRANQSAAGAPQSARATIVGSVVDAQLTPLENVAITLEHAGRPEANTATDAEGKFRFAGVAPGSYRIRAEHRNFPAFVRDLKVPAGVQTIQLPIVLTRPQDKLAAPPAESPLSAGGPARAQPPALPSAPPIAGPVAVTAGSAVAGGRGGGGMGSGTITMDGLSAVPQPQYRNDSIVGGWPVYPPESGESYGHVAPNRFQRTLDRPLSTFGADVDTASYSNVRRFLSSGQLPPADAVRIEELVNYFHFDYAAPHDGRPIALTTEIGVCPWAPSHKLVLIGARAKASVPREIEGRNIVLLIDVSGSMAPPERLPLIKSALGMFVDTLRPDDRIAIVTYAGSSGIALPSTPARERDVIQRAIAQLSAGGSTNGGQGLIMAYRAAREAFISGGVNRVVLATDGDFNVGIVDQVDLLRLIEREKESGVFLSVFGVGSGNLKDSTMEMLADKGNGHYAYLDSLQEARRVLIREGDATLETVAKDVKFQVEFNPAVVGSWKLIGYENRRLAAQDFNNDRKDGGEMGAGHTVTVLYELVPAGVVDDDRASARPDVDPLRYQARPPVIRPVPEPPSPFSGEWLTVKARYKTPEGEESSLLTLPVRMGGRVQHLPFAATVAEFGLLLRDAPHDVARWEALARRIGQIDVASTLSADKQAFRELVAIASGLARLGG